MKKIIIISLSKQYTMQESTMLLKEQYNNKKFDIFTITPDKMLFTKFQKTNNNIFVKSSDSNKKQYQKDTVLKITNIIHEISPDYILFYSSHVINLKILFSLRRKIKIIHVIHDVMPHDNILKTILINFYNMVVSKLSHSIIVHSKGYIDIAKKKYGLNENKIHFIPLLRKFNGRNDISKTNKFLFFGRISDYKGVKNLLNIIINCPNQVFLIIGRFSKDVKKYRDKFEKFKNVILDDSYVDELKMKYYFESSEWIILPYKKASQSGVIPDAYTFSRPVIAFDVGFIKEQVSSNSGFLIEQKNVSKFITQIKKCSKMNLDEIEIYSKEAFNYGFSKFSFSENASSFYSIFY